MKAYKWILCAILVVLIGCAFVFFGIFRSDDSTLHDSSTPTVPTEAVSAQETGVTEFDFSEDDFNMRLVTVINAYRQRYNLPAWAEDPALSQAANTRAEECSILESKGHTRPDGSEWYTVLNISENYNYSEITGISGQSPDDLLRSWVDSDTINNGLLSAEYTTYGVACKAIGSDVYCVLILYKP